MASAQVELKDKIQNGTKATLNNHTAADMQLLRCNSWSGRFTSLPRSITRHGGVGLIEHLKGKQGSKAGVSYTITSSTGAPYAVILAWSAPTTHFNRATSPNRLYGTLGTKSLIDVMTWDQIQTQLDKAGSSVVINDEASNICFRSTITNNPQTQMADVRSSFILMA